MAIGTFDTYKALTETDYAAAFMAYKTEENNMGAWVSYNDEATQIKLWLRNSGVQPFIDQVVNAKGLELVLCLSSVTLDAIEYRDNHKFVLKRISLLDGNVFIHVSSSIDITTEVMNLFWADLKTKM